MEQLHVSDLRTVHTREVLLLLLWVHQVTPVEFLLLHGPTQPDHHPISIQFVFYKAWILIKQTH